MKKTYLIIAATALVALSACTKNEVRSISDEPSQITWQTVIGPKSTKALVDGSAFDKDYKFKTYAFYNANGTTWQGQAPEDKASLYIDNAVVSYHTNTAAVIPAYWGTEKEYYWPKGGSLTFISYTVIDSGKKATSYPTSVSCDATNGLKVTGYDVDADANKNLDFMVAYATGQTANTTTGNAGSTKGVPTEFHHALTQITGFNVTTQGDYKTVEGNVVKAGSYVFKIKEIKIVNPYNKGDYSLKTDATGAWNSTKYTEQGDKSTYTYKISEGKSDVFDKNNAVSLFNEQKAFLPQTFDKVNYTFKGQTDLEKAREKRTQTYIDELKKVPYIEFSYSISYYGEDGKISFTDNATDYISLNEIHGKDGWQINKKITYNVSINITGTAGEMVIYWDPTVKGWEDNTIGGVI